MTKPTGPNGLALPALVEGALDPAQRAAVRLAAEGVGVDPSEWARVPGLLVIAETCAVLNLTRDAGMSVRAACEALGMDDWRSYDRRYWRWCGTWRRERQGVSRTGGVAALAFPVGADNRRAA